MTTDPTSDLTIQPLRGHGDMAEAMGYDGRTITAGCIVTRRTGGPRWLVEAITDDGAGRALLSLVAPHDRGSRAQFHADFAVLIQPAKETR